MTREFNVFDMIIGFCFGVALAFIGLRLAGLLDQGTAIWGQLALLPGIGLTIARQIALRSPATRLGRAKGGHNG